MKEKLKQIIYYYGINHQQRKLNEEVFELQEAIIIKENNQFSNVLYNENIIEEIADVMVVLEQIKVHYNLDEEDINSIMEHKINRTLERLKDK